MMYWSKGQNGKLGKWRKQALRIQRVYERIHSMPINLF